MPNPKPPRLTKWRDSWYIFYFDWIAGEPRRLSCKSHEASNRNERERLLSRVKDKCIRDQVRRTSFVGGSNFRRKLRDALDDYIDFLDQQAEVRELNPESRMGLSSASVASSKQCAGSFKDWLRSNGHIELSCERLDMSIIANYFSWLSSTPYRSGNSRKMRTGATVNGHRRRLGGCLRWLDMRRPKLFPDFGEIQPALKLKPTVGRRSFALTPSDLNKFFKQAQKPLPQATIKRMKNGRKETFKKSPSSEPATPIEDLFLLLACTGMRLGEALDLHWSDLDLTSGRIVINAQKTAAWRMIPLAKAPECEVAPALLRTLKKWRKERPDSEYVLRHDGIPKPAYPKNAWARVRKKSGVDITPQKLRQNFVSYCASMGVPPAVAAMWCGHSAAVAEKHYRLQLMDRKKAKSIQGAMGL